MTTQADASAFPYRVRPGIVTEKICRTTVLIPTRAVSSECKAVQQLNVIQAADWKMICDGRSEEELIQFHKILSKRSDEEIKARLYAFCDSLVQRGFLLRAEEAQ